MIGRTEIEFVWFVGRCLESSDFKKVVLEVKSASLAQSLCEETCSLGLFTKVSNKSKLGTTITLWKMRTRPSLVRVAWCSEHFNLSRTKCSVRLLEACLLLVFFAVLTVHHVKFSLIICWQNILNIRWLICVCVDFRIFFNLVFILVEPKLEIVVVRENGSFHCIHTYQALLFWFTIKI